MAKAKKGPKRKTSLAAFLRKLWSRPDLMERFSESRAGRQEVLSEFRLTPKHARLLLDGCVRDIVLELAGATKLAMNATTIIGAERGSADVRCGHHECEAFMSTLIRTRPGKKR